MNIKLFLVLLIAVVATMMATAELNHKKQLSGLSVEQVSDVPKNP